MVNWIWNRWKASLWKEKELEKKLYVCWNFSLVLSYLKSTLERPKIYRFWLILEFAPIPTKWHFLYRLDVLADIDVNFENSDFPAFDVLDSYQEIQECRSPTSKLRNPGFLAVNKRFSRKSNAGLLQVWTSREWPKSVLAVCPAQHTWVGYQENFCDLILEKNVIGFLRFWISGFWFLRFLYSCT